MNKDLNLINIKHLNKRILVKTCFNYKYLRPPDIKLI